MAFIESPVFPDTLGYGASGGAQFRTTIIVLGSGHEQRNADWSDERRKYDLIHAAKTRTQLNAIGAYQLTVARGRLNAFRFKDPFDNDDTHFDGAGILGAGVGAGVPTYQMVKRYASGSNYSYRDIKKPYGTIPVTRGGSPVTYGASAGNIAIDATTGVITFVADDSKAIASHTPGSSHVFTTAANVTQLGIGDKVYITGVTGTGATTLNTVAHTISNKTGSGPYTWTLATNTSGLTTSSGTIYAYPQADEALLWSGNFHTPVRFDTDELIARLVAKNIYQLDSIPIVEVRL